MRVCPPPPPPLPAQFSTLAQHTHIDGLEEMIKAFFKIVEDFRRKPYDLMDYTKNQFDRDYLEFNVNIHDLETTLQGFINSSFENITSTEHALNLLRQFQTILQVGPAPSLLPGRSRGCSSSSGVCALLLR